MNNTCTTNVTANSKTVSSGLIGSNGTWAINNTTISTDSVLTINGDRTSLDVKGKMVINGRDLEERLDTIEKVLQIPERDVKLESIYPKLKTLYDEYIKELSKARMWESLKGTKND